MYRSAARNPETTYEDSYRRGPYLPPIKYHQPISIELDVRFNHTLPMLPPRQFPVEPPGPKKILLIEQSPGFGLGTNINIEKFLDPKPIVRTHPPAELFKHLQRSRPKSGKKRNAFLRNALTKDAIEGTAEMKKEIDRDIINSYTFSTNAQRAGEAAMPCTEVPPPQNTLEVNADLVKYRPQRYEEETGEWQCVGLDWDKVQIRPPINHFLREDQTKDRPRPVCGPVSHERRKLDNQRYQDVSREIRSLLEDNNLNPICDRKCPHYAGFVPRAPIESCTLARKPDAMISNMKESYRPYPPNPFSVPADYTPGYPHKSPLSKAVTLTYPYNAFNNNGCQRPLKFTYHI